MPLEPTSPFLPEVSNLDLQIAPIEDLCESYIDENIPVVLWATMNMSEASGSTSWICKDTNEKITWITPAHALLLVGYDRDNYYFNDPLVGEKIAYPKEQCKTAYEGMFSQAVAVYKK